MAPGTARPFGSEVVATVDLGPFPSSRHTTTVRVV